MTGKLDVLIREDIAPRIERTARSPGSAYPRGDMRTETIPFQVLDYGMEMALADEKRAFYRNSFDAEAAFARKAVVEIVAGHEDRTATLIFNTSTWTGANLYTDISTSAPWDTANSDVIDKTQTAILVIKKNTGMRPNALLATESAIIGLVSVNTAIRSLMGTANALPWRDRLQLLASILGVDELIIAGASKNAAIEGQDFSGSSFWDEDYAMLLRVAKTDDPDEPCVGRTVIWDEFGSELTSVGTYREPQTKSDIIQVDSKHVELILDIYFGHLLKIDA